MLDDHTVIDRNALVVIDMAGVHLHLDVANEDLYIETEFSFEQTALVWVTELARSWGFDVIPYAEAPPESFVDGRMRHYLTQTHFPELVEEMDDWRVHQTV